MAHDRKTHHKDLNHNSISEEARARGYEWDDTFAVPGLYDGVCSGVAAWSQGRAVGVRVEIKRPELRAKGMDALTPAERKYWEKPHFDNLIMAYTWEDIAAWFGHV